MSDTSPTLARRIGTALIVLALAATAGLLAYGIVTHDSSETGADAGARPGADSDFVYAEGNQLMLHGEQFRYAGANAYTLMFESPAGVDVNMQTAVDDNLTALRAWAFFDQGGLDGNKGVEINNRGIYFQYWDEEAGAPAYNDGASGLEHLDYMLYSAGQHNIKLVLPLVNNWTAFGGVDQYVRWADGTWHDDFFRDEQIKQWYKDWVSHVLNRVNPLTGIAYKDDPSVMIWELGNELRCSESGPYLSSQKCSSGIFVDWAREMSDYVRSIDSNHLIGFGGEGFLCTHPGGPSTLTNCAESGDPGAITALPNIDLNGIHVYPNHWNPTEPTDDWEDWGVWWIEQHGAIANDANKPFYIGEYGWVSQTSRMQVFDRWLQAFYDNGGDGSHFWLMQPASSISAPADSVGFSQKCPGAACDLVGAWSAHVRDGVPWSEFAPLAENDQLTIPAGATARVDVLANDHVFGDATWDMSTLDLDPDAAGVQTEFDTGHGMLRVDGGVVVFTHDPSSSGTARAKYTVMDSNGKTTPPAAIALIIGESS